MARISSCSLREVSGSVRMALLSWSYKTMRYLLPREEVTGKRPVLSVLTFPVNSIVCRYAIWVRTLDSCKGRGGFVITGGLEMVVAGEVFLVDCRFFRVGGGAPLWWLCFWVNVFGKERN